MHLVAELRKQKKRHYLQLLVFIRIFRICQELEVMDGESGNLEQMNSSVQAEPVEDGMMKGIWK